VSIDADPVGVVTGYLSLCEQRRLADAARYLAANAELIFPGARRYTDLSVMAEDAARRYRSVSKTYELTNAHRDSTGDWIVVTIGTLAGVSLAGTPFDGVRFLDRFVVRDGKIVQQQVFNDLAESGVLQR
jgi:hypothetical protein